MQECEHKFDKNNNFSKNTNILQEVGTNSRIHTFRMQKCTENCEKTSNVEKDIVRGARCCSPTWCCLLSQTSVSPWELLAKCSYGAIGTKWSKIEALVHYFRKHFDVVQNSSIRMGPGSCSTHHLMWLGVSITKNARKQQDLIKTCEDT